MHEQFGIGIVEHGGQLSHSGRGQVEAGAGDVITVNPGEVHDGTPVGDSGRAWRILYFEPAVIARAAADVFGAEPGGFELNKPVVRNDRAGALVRELFSTTTRTQDDQPHEELLLATLFAIGAERIAPDGERLTPDIAKVKSRIDDDPAAPTSLADLAEVTGLGKFQLLRAFARVTGFTPHAYIVQRRVELARRLVAAGTPLADAAAASGFADQSHMTRAFVGRYGLTPGAYAVAAGSA